MSETIGSIEYEGGYDEIRPEEMTALLGGLGEVASRMIREQQEGGADAQVLRNSLGVRHAIHLIGEAIAGSYDPANEWLEAVRLQRPTAETPEPTPREILIAGVKNWASREDPSAIVEGYTLAIKSGKVGIGEDGTVRNIGNGSLLYSCVRAVEILDAIYATVDPEDVWVLRAAIWSHDSSYVRELLAPLRRECPMK